jgi:hypothetical protein
MFILKRQDVEITSFQHPSKEQKIPILVYQGQTFRLLSMFGAAQEEEARALWRDLTDNRGKACVLLEEPDRFSVWGKIRLDLSKVGSVAAPTNVSSAFVQACILIVQAIYEDLEDLMGSKQAKSFQTEIAILGNQHKIPQMASEQAVDMLLKLDPFASSLPAWQERHLNLLLKEIHQISQKYFGKSNFSDRALEALDDLPPYDRDTFLKWLQQSPNAKLWT